MKTVRVATAQFYSDEDTEANLALCCDYIERAAAGGARFVVLPENANRTRMINDVTYADRETCYAKSEPNPGPFFDGLCEAARRNNIYVVVNIDTRGEQEPDVYITSFLIGPTGEIIGSHDKTILWDYEYGLFVPGHREFQVFDTEIGRIGMIICGDGILMEVPRVVALMGAQIICNCLNSRGPDEMRVHIPLRAIENGCYHISSNTVCGPLEQFPWTGGSQVVAPDGEVLACASETEPDLVFADIQPERANEKRTPFVENLMTWRRPELYQLLSVPVGTLPAAKFYQNTAFDAPALPVKVAVMQHSRYHSYEFTLKRAEGQIRYAGWRGAKLGVLPQLFPFDLDEPANDPARCAEQSRQVLQLLQGAVREAGLWQAASLVEEDGGAYFHTAYLLNPNGEVAGTYRKTHLNDTEQRWATAGDDLPVFETDVGVLGMFIGDEVWVPEVPRVLSLKGAEILLHPCAWMSREEMQVAAVERGEESKVHVLSANRLDSKAPYGSQIVSPDFPFFGQPIAMQRMPMAYTTRYGFEEELIMDIDRRTAQSKMMGLYLDCLEKRVPSIYHIISDETMAAQAG